MELLAWAFLVLAVLSGAAIGALVLPLNVANRVADAVHIGFIAAVVAGWLGAFAYGWFVHRHNPDDGGWWYVISLLFAGASTIALSGLLALAKLAVFTVHRLRSGAGV